MIKSGMTVLIKCIHGKVYYKANNTSKKLIIYYKANTLIKLYCSESVCV